MSYMKKGDSRLCFARRRAEMDTSLQLICVTIKLETTGDEKTYLPVGSGQFLLTGRDLLDRTMHNGFEVREG